MVRSSAKLYRKVVDVLSLDGPPARLALALATGMFISCTPFYGFHTVIALVTAFICRLNKAVTVTGAWLNLPWFAPLVYGVSLKIGEFLLGGPEAEAFSEIPWADMIPSIWPPSSWPRLLDELGQHSLFFFYLSKALLVGTTVVGLLTAAATYVVALAAIRQLRRLRYRASSAAPPPAAADSRATRSGRLPE
jgi:uncharacterized protein (DUF2062 family)